MKKVLKCVDDNFDGLVSNLQQGYPLQKSILKSKRYIEGFLSANKSLIGRHRL